MLHYLLAAYLLEGATLKYTEAVSRDRRLQKEADAVGERLGGIRWWWTHPESGNPERVSYVQYGRDVGRDRKTISRYALAYAEFRNGDNIIPFSDALTRQLIPSKYEAAAAVASELGVQPTSVQGNHYDKVKTAHRIAEDRAEARGTSYEEELPEAARDAVRIATPTPKKQHKTVSPPWKVEVHWGERIKAKIGQIMPLLRDIGEAIDKDPTAKAHAQADIDEMVELMLAITGQADWDGALAELQETT